MAASPFYFKSLLLICLCWYCVSCASPAKLALLLKQSRVYMKLAVMHSFSFLFIF